MKKREMKTEESKVGNLLLVVVIVAVCISVIGVGITYNRLSSFKNKLTGFATDSGTINLSVESAATINFTTSNINWGSGRVTDGEDNATLNTAAGASNITNGNWTGNTAGLVIENIGNVNVTLNISTGVAASSLLGGTSPIYELNFTEVEGGSCLNSTDETDESLGSFATANTTHRIFCDKFPFDDGNDTVRIDVRLVIPSDSKTGAIGDVITATFESA